MSDELKPVVPPPPAAAPSAAPVRVQAIKYAPPPPDLPILGKIDPKDISFFGRTNYVAALEEKKFIFGIKREDRLRHLYIIGKSGVGKTKLMELLMRQDIEFGRGLCLIDPYGALAKEILATIPEKRSGDVCLIDPTDADFPVLFNPFAAIHPDFRHQFAQCFIEVLAKQFGASWTPRIEHVARFATLALLAYPYATLRGMIQLLTEHEYREQVLAYVEDEMVKRFWLKEYESWSGTFEAEAVAPLVSRLEQFLADPLLRAIFSQSKNAVDIDLLIKQDKIILVNLAKSRIGEANASFFGSLVLAKIKQAGMARARAAEGTLRDFYVYIDEFHTVASETFESILAEAPTYGLSLTLSHQYMAQLPPRTLSAVLGTVGTIITFRIGGADAALLEDEFAPIFKVKDMINLGRQEFYIKMAIDGQAYDAFSAQTLKVMPRTTQGFTDKIIAASRRTYAYHAPEEKKEEHKPGAAR
jgi:type IV secretory pathway TraG/TraD family ATPase VirD4